MLSKPLAFGLLVAACVVAAGGGAYIATLQHAGSSEGVAPASLARPADPTPQPVGASQAQATANPVAEPTSVPAVPDSSSSTSGASTAKPAAAPKKAPARAADTTGRDAGASHPAVVAPSAPPATVQPLPTPQADQGIPVQRPWPGPPVSAQLPPSFPGDQGRPEGDASHDNVKLWEEMVVPSESVLGLQLETSVNTDYARIEDRVDAKLTRDVRVSGRVAVPSGTRVIGSVVLVERGGKVKERSRIGITFNTLVMGDGTKIPITTDTVFREGDSPANKASAKIGGAAIGGAIIGAILGGGKGAAIGSGIGAGAGTAAAMNGARIPVVMSAGTAVSVRTQSPITVTVEK
jgi:hypothetical protein